MLYLSKTMCLWVLQPIIKCKNEEKMSLWNLFTHLHTNGFCCEKFLHKSPQPVSESESCVRTCFILPRLPHQAKSSQSPCSHTFTGTNDQLVNLQLFLFPICLHFPTTFPCCRAALRVFLLNTRNLAPESQDQS